MNTIQTAFSSARFTRLMFWTGGIVLAAGILVLVSTLVRNSDSQTIGPEQGFRPTLPAHSTQLKNANGATINTFWQLDPEVRSTIRTFLGSAVARKHLDQSWGVVAPSVKAGYTYKRWKNADALPVIASTKEILIDVGVSSRARLRIRPASFQLGLVPVGKGANTRWLVDYWMPRWTPPLPAD